MKHPASFHTEDYTRVTTGNEYILVEILQDHTGTYALYTPEKAKELAQDLIDHANKIIAERPRYSQTGRGYVVLNGAVVGFSAGTENRQLIVDALNAFDATKENA